MIFIWMKKGHVRFEVLTAVFMKIQVTLPKAWIFKKKGGKAELKKTNLRVSALVGKSLKIYICIY